MNARKLNAIEARNAAIILISRDDKNPGIRHCLSRFHSAMYEELFVDSATCTTCKEELDRSQVIEIGGENFCTVPRGDRPSCATMIEQLDA